MEHVKHPNTPITRPTAAESMQRFGAVSSVQRVLGPFDWMNVRMSWHPNHGWDEVIVTIVLGETLDSWRFTSDGDLCTDPVALHLAAMQYACWLFLNPSLFPAA